MTAQKLCQRKRRPANPAANIQNRVIRLKPRVGHAHFDDVFAVFPERTAARDIQMAGGNSGSARPVTCSQASKR